MRKSLSLLLAAVLTLTALVAAAALTTSPAQASPGDEYVGPFYGDGNLPPGCIKDMSRDNPANTCYHAKVGLNALDSPIVDVAVVVPASPTAERDLRIMRQAAEAWEGGIQYLSDEMGLDWLRDGVKFHISSDVVGLTEGEQPSTYPLYDPEIVIVATNPAGGAGIGVDPTYLTDELGILDENGVPCHNIPNPFSLDTWEGMPGYDGHHGDNGGIYVEDCGGAGGNVCFSVNGGIDPVPGTTDMFSLFDLVLHETGHCLTLGHVGDGAETPAWGPVPTTDIMAYSYDPPGANKCVSTLNVEAFALRMSHYLDVDGDGAVTQGDSIEPNDVVGDGTNSFQVQRPSDHLFASSTGSVYDCPKPDLGLVPGARTDWTPEPVDTHVPVLTVDTPEQGARTTAGTVHVGGSVERRPVEAPPTSTTASAGDPDGDAVSDLTDIQQLDVAVTDLEVTAVLKVKKLWPSTTVVSPSEYSVSIGGRQIKSFVPDPRSPAEVTTYDHSMEQPLPSDWSEWDTAANTVTFHIPRSYLAGAKVTAPYDVFALSGYIANNKFTVVADDRAPDTKWVSVAAPAGSAASSAGSTTTSGSTSGSGGAGSTLDTVVLEQPGGNSFTVADTSLGTLTGSQDRFTLSVPQASDVELLLAWGDNSDLDMSVTGAGTGSAATAGQPERLVLTNVRGQLDITVDPYLVVGVPKTAYTLTATLVDVSQDGDGDGVTDGDDRCPTVSGPAPSGCPDTDGDGVPDVYDTCPQQPGNGAEGCPIPATEHVRVYVDGVLAGSQDVDTAGRRVDTFGIDVAVAPGTHELRIDWEDDGEVVATVSRTVIRTAAGTDSDRDGVADSTDNCPKQPNADQADLDRDGQGNACDKDIDGDGHSNDKERQRGTDPYDPKSYPGNKPKAPTLGR